VIPATAVAKVSFRLVPDQDPDEIYRLVSDYLTRLAPPTVKLTFSLLGRATPATSNLDSSVVKAANEAFLRGFGVPPKFVRGGGSIPIMTIMQENLHPDVLLTGFGLPDDGEHAPNESLALEQFYRGIDMMVHYFHCLMEKE
jgi:acetylornithine deacetylase/succinyl-diaminopimelate desuccinylase-like protein